jgi:hypothetical protein
MSGLIDLSGTNLRINYSDTIQNILCTQTSTIFFNEIDLSGGITAGPLPNAFNYTSDMIGYTFRSTGTGALTPADQIYDISNFSLNPGIYIIYLVTVMIPTTTTMNIFKISVGLTTTATSFTGGTGEIVALSNVKLETNITTSGRCLGKTMTILTVPTTATYYFVAQISSSPQSATWDRTTSFCICTRIA